MVRQLPTTAKSLNELMGPALEPAIRRRGLAKVDILTWWPEIVGAAYATLSRPHSIRWPKTSGVDAAALVVRCDPSIALQMAHERDGIRERLNGFLGYPAIGDIRLVQHPLAVGDDDAPRQQKADPRAVQALRRRLETMDPGLREAFLAFGTAILARS